MYLVNDLLLTNDSFHEKTIFLYFKKNEITDLILTENKIYVDNVLSMIQNNSNEINKCL